MDATEKRASNILNSFYFVACAGPTGFRDNKQQTHGDALSQSILVSFQPLEPIVGF
jgi:hypothetical protein